MIKVHHAGKMGDVIYALPVLRALARQSGGVHLTTSGLCWQLVPLLWEQPYLLDVVLDETRPYGIPFDGPNKGITTNWEFFKDGEGINLSLQPKHYELDCPINWTWAYAKIAGVTELEAGDYMGLPSLVNHRRWFYGVQVSLDGKPQPITKTVVVAPEVETLEAASPETWMKVMDGLADDFRIVLVGTKTDFDYKKALFAWRDGKPMDFTDLRGLTTVPTLARLIAEAAAFVGAHSLPWHLARQAHAPALCLQHFREGLRRCIPMDSPPELCPWVEPAQWASGVQWIKQQATSPVGG